MGPRRRADNQMGDEAVQVHDGTAGGMQDGGGLDAAALAAAHDALAEGVLVISRAGEVVYANEIARSEGVVVGRNVLREPGWPALARPGVPFPDCARPGPIALRTGRPVRDAEMAVRAPNGEHYWVSTDAVPIRLAPDGSSELVAIVFRETTLQRRQRAELEAKVAIEQLVARVSRALGAATSESLLDDLRAALAAVAQHLGVDRGRLVRISDNGREMRTPVWWSAPGIEDPPDATTPIPVDDVPMVRELLLGAKLFVVEMDDAPSELLDEGDRFGRADAQTVIAVPLVVEQEVLGAVALESRRSRSWSPTERNLLEQLSAMVGATIARVRAERMRRRSQEMVELIVSSSPDLIVAIDNEARPSYLSLGITRLFGYAPDHWIGRSIVDLVHPDDLGAVVAAFRDVALGRTSETVELRTRHADGHWVWVEVVGRAIRDGDRVTGAVVNVRDVSERRRAAEALADAERQFVRRLEYEATHDALTALPQRKLILDHLDRALAAGRADGSRTAVLFIDLDHFKRVNDSLGHSAGDELLEAFARRLTAGVRGRDLAGRLGGDEFVVVCRDVGSPRDAVDIANRLLALVEAPFTVAGLDVYVGASIGIAVAEPDSDAASLLRAADTAAYRAKETGRNHCELFDDALRAEVEERLETETALRRALDRGEVIVHYQLIVSTDDGRICAFEALARWDRPGFGLVAPDRFLAAEENGLIVPLGLEVFRHACEQAAAWRARFGDAAPTVSVNLSVLQLAQVDFLQSIRAILADTGVEPTQLCLEVTETSIMRDPTASVALLRELRAMGFVLAIDDFGTGYSSLSHLRQLPVDVLKIDRSFILEIGVDHEGATIVASIVGLAHALGMEIVAEGVETIEHVASLHNLGCDRLQGFYFAPALTPEAATEAAGFGRLLGRRAS